MHALLPNHAYVMLINILLQAGPGPTQLLTSRNQGCSDNSVAQMCHYNAIENEVIGDNATGKLLQLSVMYALHVITFAENFSNPRAVVENTVGMKYNEMLLGYCFCSISFRVPY